jgi:hypothetical protein
MKGFVSHRVKTLLIASFAVVVLVMAIIIVTIGGLDKWLFLVCAAGTIVLVTSSGFGMPSEFHIRFVGVICILSTAFLAVYALSDIRAHLDQPNVMAGLVNFLESPEIKTGAALVGEASDYSEAQGSLTVHPKILSTEDRFTALEDQLAKLESIQATGIATINRTIRNNSQMQNNRDRDLVSAVKALKDLLVEVQTGGLAMALLGIVWLIIGTVLTGLPGEIERRLNRMHRRRIEISYRVCGGF